jgi:hypothetical protein
MAIDEVGKSLTDEVFLHYRGFVIAAHAQDVSTSAFKGCITITIVTIIITITTTIPQSLLSLQSSLLPSATTTTIPIPSITLITTITTVTTITTTTALTTISTNISYRLVAARTFSCS